MSYFILAKRKRFKWFKAARHVYVSKRLFSFHTEDVMHVIPVSFYSLCCTYRVGHNEVIGVCRVGNDADTLGRNHWSEMLTYPRKPVAHWHPLVEVRWLCRGRLRFVSVHACTDRFKPFLLRGRHNLLPALSDLSGRSSSFGPRAKNTRAKPQTQPCFSLSVSLTNPRFLGGLPTELRSLWSDTFNQLCMFAHSVSRLSNGNKTKLQLLTKVIK